MTNSPKGMIAMPALIFMVTAALVIVIETMIFVAKKGADGNQSFDAVAALMLAQSGLEHGAGRLAVALNNKKKLDIACAEIAVAGAYPLEAGQFLFQSPSVAPTKKVCTVRVQGSVGDAIRVLEASFVEVKEKGVSLTFMQNWHEVLSNE